MSPEEKNFCKLLDVYFDALVRGGTQRQIDKARLALVAEYARTTDWQQIARERTADIAKADAEIERLQQRVAEMERDGLEVRRQRNDEQRLRQAAERASTEYLKDGETAAECIERNRRDVVQSLGMLAAERKKVESLTAERDDWRAAYNRVALAARAVTAELQKVGDATQWQDGDETDRVYAWHEMQALAAALDADIHSPPSASGPIESLSARKGGEKSDGLQSDHYGSHALTKFPGDSNA